MKIFIRLVSLLFAATTLAAGCGQVAPAPSPAKPPAATPKAPDATAAPTGAPTKAPTAAPVKKVDFPDKGKTVTIIVGHPAGGGADVQARIIAPVLERQLGIPVQVTNKGEAGTQVAMTEMVTADPDGYTMVVAAMPTFVSAYLDLKRQAIYAGKDLRLLSRVSVQGITINVRGDSPYKTLKDLVEAVKARPEKVTMGSGAINGSNALMVQLLEKAANMKFATVALEGGGPVRTALLGGHVDVAVNTVGEVSSLARAGEIRVLALSDEQESRFLPGAPTLKSLGYDVDLTVGIVVVMRSDTPKEIMDVLTGVMRKTMSDDTVKAMFEKAEIELRYLDGEELAANWKRVESNVEPLIQ